MTMHRGAFALALGASLFAVAPSARADDPSAADVVLARQLGNEGVELANQGRCEEALVKLERAEQLHHAPSLLLRIGECQLKLGRLVAALSSLDRVARENLGPTPPKAFVTAQQRATALLAELKPKLGSLRVDATGARDDVSFTVDGAELKAAALGLDRPVDPGKHVIEATLADGRRIRREVIVAEGSSQSVSLDLPAAAPQPAAGSTVARAGMTTGNDGSRSDGLRTVGWGLVVGGGVALVASGAFAAMTLSSKSDLDAACADKRCPASAEGDYDAAKTTATLSGVALGVGVVAVAAGVYLVLSRKPQRTGELPRWVTFASTGSFAF